MLGRTVEELEHGVPGSFRPLSALEEREWEAYEHVFGPLDESRLEAYLAQIAHAIVAVNIEKPADRPELREFVFDFDDGLGKPVDMETAIRQAAAITVRHGGKDMRPRGV